MWQNKLLLIPLIAMLLLPGRPSTVLLTFDTELPDSPEDVNNILDILRERNIKATFFVLGEFMDRYPEIIQRIQDEGHELAYHSNHHPLLTKLSSRQLAEEVTRPEGVVGFRAPWHWTNPLVMNAVYQAGYSYDATRLDTLAWRPNPLPELLVNTWFGIPVSDTIYSYYLKMPGLWRFLVTRIKSDELVVVVHPHLVDEETFIKLLDNFDFAEFKRCKDAI